MKLSSFIHFEDLGIKTILSRKKEPILRTIIVTDKCNLSCMHCCDKWYISYRFTVSMYVLLQGIQSFGEKYRRIKYSKRFNATVLFYSFTRYYNPKSFFSQSRASSLVAKCPSITPVSDISVFFFV